MHIRPLLHRRYLREHPPDIQERLDVAPQHNGGKALADDGQRGEAAAHLADADEHLGDVARERLGEVVRLRDEGVDDVDLGGETAEEEVAVRGVGVGFDI